MTENVVYFSDHEEPYHVNFCCRVVDLDSPRPLCHAAIFFNASKSHPYLYRYLPFGPFQTLEDFLDWHESRVHSQPTNLLFAVFDKTRDLDSPGSFGAFAGIIGLLDMSPPHARTEIGFVITLPSFQGTHVTTNAVGLLLHYCLNLPVEGGLGLRRVQWKANAKNLASIRVAEKVGFAKEGILRWHWVLPSTKDGKKSREGDPVDGPGRDTTLLAICWDDWEYIRDNIDHLIKCVP